MKKIILLLFCFVFISCGYEKAYIDHLKKRPFVIGKIKSYDDTHNVYIQDYCQEINLGLNSASIIMPKDCGYSIGDTLKIEYKKR